MWSLVRSIEPLHLASGEHIPMRELEISLFQRLAGGSARIVENCDGCEGEASPELDTFAAAFAVAGEDQEKAADKRQVVLLNRFSSQS